MTLSTLLAGQSIGDIVMCISVQVAAGLTRFSHGSSLDLSELMLSLSLSLSSVLQNKIMHIIILFS